MKHKISDVLKIFRMITSFSYVVQHGNMACVSGIVGWIMNKAT